MRETLYVQDDDPTKPDRRVTEDVERAAFMASLVAETRLCHVEVAPGGVVTRTVLNGANEAAVRQGWAKARDAQDERRTRTYRVYRRPAPAHAGTPVETPETVTFGQPGDVFTPADLAQFKVDLSADRLEPVP